MTPDPNWLSRWADCRDRLRSFVDLNEYFTLPEIAGRRLAVFDIGPCSVPTGRMLARDPLVHLENLDAPPYFQAAPAGTYPVELCAVLPQKEGERTCFAAARIRFSDAPAVRFEEALTGTEELDTLGEESYFGFNVDGGLACICDQLVQNAFSRFLKDFRQKNPEDSFYDSCLAPQFAENRPDHPHSPQKPGGWINWQIPGTSYHLPLFRPGFGNGAYPVYWGTGSNGEICQLIAQFIDIRLAYGNAGSRLSVNDFVIGEGVCEKEITLPAWSERFGAEESLLLCFDVDAAQRLTSFTEQQQAAYDYLCRYQAEIAESILQALLAEYSELQHDYGYTEEEKASCMPDVTSPAELAALLCPESIVLYSRQKGGLPYIGVTFGCPWDEEHGFGAMLCGCRPVRLGGAETGLLRWVAARDAGE